MKTTKQIGYLMLGAIALASCQPTQRANVSGTLSGIGSDTLLVRSMSVGNSKEMQLDTVPMQNGNFAFSVNDSVLKHVFISAMPSAGENSPMRGIDFYLLPQKPVRIVGSIGNYTLSGDAFYDDCSRLDAELFPLFNRIDSLGKACMQMERDSVPADSVQRAYEPAREWMQSMVEIRCNFIRDNADKDASVYALSGLNLKAIGEMLDVVGQPARDGAMAPVYQNMKQACEKAKARQEAAERIKEGLPAPDFTLKNLAGEDFTLSSLKGKYVVLDFWGSWCVWCIKGIPEMKKAYEKYQPKVEFVGIACNDTDEKWRAAVDEHQLKWINVRNDGDTDVSVLYAIQGYPTKMIIDPKGTIVKIVVGEDPEFYKALDSVLK